MTTTLSTLLFALCGAVAPGIETIYVVPMSHTDIGFTAPPSDVAKSMVAALDDAIAYARQDPDYVWVIESFWQLEQWLAENRNPEPVLDLLRSGRFGLSAAYATPHSSLMSAWALEWNFRLPAEWGRSHGLSMDWAVLDDVPGHPMDLPTRMAAAGVRYLAMGANQGFFAKLPEGISNTPFWWEGPDGSRVLVWICADNYLDAYQVYGIDPECKRGVGRGEFTDEQCMAYMREDIPAALKRYADTGYAYDAVLAFHAMDNWGAGPSMGLPHVVNLWNKAGGTPRIVLANPGVFFHHIEAKYGAALPVYRGGFGGQWEVVRLGTPTAMARARLFEEDLRAQPTPRTRDIAKLLAYWEHSFGMGPCWPDYLTRRDTARHNRDQYRMVARWPKPGTPQYTGVPAVIAPSTAGDGVLQSNVLYLREKVKDSNTFTALSAGQWTPQLPLRIEDGTLVMKHVVDRRTLPAKARVTWAWKLTEEQAHAPIEVHTDWGTVRFPDDRMLGYALEHWIAWKGFTMGSLRVESNDVYAYWRDEEGGWLFADILSQSRETTLKGKKDCVLRFGEAYPGEAPLAAFHMRVRVSSEAQTSAASQH